MKPAFRLVGAMAFALAPLSYAASQGPGKSLAMDFRTTTTVQGMGEANVVTGHIVGSSNGTVRIDLSTGGVGPTPSPLAGGSTASMIVTDSGRTITYLDATKSQYMRVRPADIAAQAQQMQGVRMVFSGIEAKVDNLGAGPAILGHPISHYRLGTAMTMTIGAMGQEQSVQISSTTEYYFATDFKSATNPFASLSGTDMMNLVGSTNKEFASKMKAAQDKLPKATPLLTSTTATMITQGRTIVTKSDTEVTSVQWVDADPKVFEVPTSFTAMPVPGMGATVPPKK